MFFIIAQCVIISALKAMALLGICLLVTCRRPVHPATMTSLFWPVNRSSLQVKWQQLCFQRGKAVAFCCLSVLDTFNCLCSLESQCVYMQFIFIQNPFVKPKTTAWTCNLCFLPGGGVWALGEHIFSCFLYFWGIFFSGCITNHHVSKDFLTICIDYRGIVSR